jgi:predicted nucleic acid-binding protein
VILVDTSIWIDFLRAGNDTLAALLRANRVSVHPWIIGELACGNLGNRNEVLELLAALPQLTPASEGEVLHFIERRRLMGRGVGYLDMHLLAASVIHGVTIWTRDRRLRDVATELGLAYQAGTP